MKLRQDRDLLLIARKRNGASVIRAPIAGRVTRINTKANINFAAEIELVVISSLKDLQVEADLDENLASRVKIGQEVIITINSKKYQGRVYKVADQALQSAVGKISKTVPAVIRFEKMPENLRLGSSALLDITINSIPSANTLLRGPYLSTGDERFVFVVDGQYATRREIRFGASSSERIEILDGLVEGEKNYFFIVRCIHRTRAHQIGKEN